MKTTTIKRLLPSIAALALAMIGTSASATSTWNYDLVGNCDPSTNQGTYVAQCAAKTNPVLDLTMSGWSTGTGSISSPSAGTTFAGAKIYDWGANYGLGIVAGNESPSAIGPHAVDNMNGTDAILLSFTSAVQLSSVTIGWNGTDNTGEYDNRSSSDLSVLAYTGTTPPASATTGLSGKTVPQLLASGWQLIGNYGQVGHLTSLTNPDNTALIASAVSSSWWLISAYNPSYTISGTPVSSSGYALTSGNDYFKLLSVAGGIGSAGQTPEPGSLALIGLALMGLLASRRRQIQV